MKRCVLALVAFVAAATFAGLVNAAPAQAAPQREGFVAISPFGDTFPGWFWIDEMEGIIGCPKCLHWFDVEASRELRAEAEVALNGGIMAGLGQLSEATVTADPLVRARLRDMAVEHFTSAARALGAASPRTGDVGYYDPDRGASVATGSPWLAAADQDIVDGISLLQRALQGPTPEPWIAAAVAEFDEAYEELSTKRVIG